MAIEYNVTAEDKFFLGEDKTLELTIFQQDLVTPLNVVGMNLEWNLRKTDKAADPAILVKGLGSGLSVVGVFNADPLVNTQRVRVVFASDDTDPLVTALLGTPYTLKPNVAYRHSLKRRDAGSEAILTFGSWTFMQATER